MHRPITAIVLAAALAVSLVTLVAAIRLPGDNQGYAPVQPIAYSHKLHAGDLQIQCTYCHFAAEKGRHAGIPPLNVCMNCHSGVSATLAAVKLEEENAKQQNRAPKAVESPELRKLYDALALDETLSPIAGKAPEADRLETDSQASRLRVLRSPRAHRGDRPVPDLPRSHRNDGARTTVRNARHGVVRQLPPRRQRARRQRQAGPCVD